MMSYYALDQKVRRIAFETLNAYIELNDILVQKH